MRVLMLSQFYAPVLGGQERAVEDLSVALADRGHHVAVATLAAEGFPPVETRDGVVVHRIRGTAQRARRAFSDPSRRHVPPVPDPGVTLALRRIVAAEGPDVVHAHDWMVHSFVGPWTRAVPLVMTMHDHSVVCATKRLIRDGEPCSGPGPVRCLVCASRHYGIVKGVPTAAAVRVQRAVLPARVDALLPVSTAVATTAGLDPTDPRVHIVPNFVPRTPAAHAAADHSDLPDRDFILFVGDATYDKGINVLIEAHRRLPDRPLLVVIGRPLEPSLHAPPDDVVILGPRSRDIVRAAQQRTIVACVPSLLAEAFGLVALEAMVVGTPVVASRTGGLADIVVDGETGFLTPPGDATALSGALRRLVDDPALRSRMGNAARRRADAFSEASVVARIEDVYRTVAA